MTFKQKWSNYWYHYKWHTFGVLFVIILIAGFVMTASFKKEPDLYMVYMSNSIISEDNQEKIKSGFVKDGAVGDVDKDGEVLVYMEHIVSTFNVNDPVDEGTAAKMQTVLYGGQHHLMLVHRYALEDYEDIFEDIGDQVKDGDAVYENKTENFVSGISVEGNKYLESYGINTKDLYIALRRRTPEAIKNGEEKEHFDQAYKTMNFILSHQR